MKATRSKAMQAKCHDCMAGYLEGKVSCGVRSCPLYPWMPYKDSEPDLTWTKFNPKRVGQIAFEVGEEVDSED